jgi:hypothetical protein
MQVEAALFFESIEQIYERVFRHLRPRTSPPSITVSFRKYANANSRIRLEKNNLTVHISDLLESAPAPIQEALATILISKLYRRRPDPGVVLRYQRYLNRADVRKMLHAARHARGRKAIRGPEGRVFNLVDVFEELNFEYFHGLMARPELGWTVRPSRTTLGHYDPSHHVIVLSSILDSEKAPKLVVYFVMFHEMLHLKFPTEHRGFRRCVHTKSFKEAEKLFKNYRQAKVQLREFASAN